MSYVWRDPNKIGGETNNAGKYSVGQVLQNNLGDFVDAVDRLTRSFTAALLTVAQLDSDRRADQVVAVFRQVLEELDKR